MVDFHGRLQDEVPRPHRVFGPESVPSSGTRAGVSAMVSLKICKRPKGDREVCVCRTPANPRVGKTLDVRR